MNPPPATANLQVPGWVNWPWVRLFVALAAGVVGMVAAIRKMMDDRRDRQSQARQKEIADAIRPELATLRTDIQERHEENRGTLQTIQLEQAEMKVKVEDLWERRRQSREGT